MSNKDEALASFLRRKLDQGQTLTPEQVGRLLVGALFCTYIRLTMFCCRAALHIGLGWHLYAPPRQGRCSWPIAFASARGLGAYKTSFVPSRPYPVRDQTRKIRPFTRFPGVNVNAESTDCLTPVQQDGHAGEDGEAKRTSICCYYGWRKEKSTGSPKRRRRRRRCR